MLYVSIPRSPTVKFDETQQAGKNATEEFNMIHEKTVVSKYASETIIGTAYIIFELLKSDLICFPIGTLKE